MGGHDHDRPGEASSPDQPEDALDLDVVEVGGRLVGEQQRRVVGQGPRDRDPLLLAAGHGARAVTHPLGEADRSSRSGARGTGLGAAHAGQPQRRLHVLAARSGWAPG